MNTELEVVLKRFDSPDEITHFEGGKFEAVTLGGMTIGRATYPPGWKWSVDVGEALGEEFCTVEHVGMVVSGCATAAMSDGSVAEMRPGDLFYVPSEPHDSWVVGDEPYVSLHWCSAGRFIFYVGYKVDAAGRAPGFVVMNYANLALLFGCIYLLFAA